MTKRIDKNGDRLKAGPMASPELAKEIIKGMKKPAKAESRPRRGQAAKPP